jgi:hypothetical protein
MTPPDDPAHQQQGEESIREAQGGDQPQSGVPLHPPALQFLLQLLVPDEKSGQLALQARPDSHTILDSEAKMKKRLQKDFTMNRASATPTPTKENMEFKGSSSIPGQHEEQVQRKVY